MGRGVKALVLLLALVGGSAAQPPSKKSTLAKGTSAAQPKYKAIWEPVNVKEDLKLLSVYFVSPDEGWVAGGKDELHGGVILHTTDGGEKWEVQLGDPQSSDRAYTDLRFDGPKLGWAAESTSGGDHKLLHTTDGQSWNVAGTVAQHRTDYQFPSEGVGFCSGHQEILRTQDGGQQWKPAYQCSVKAEVRGLTRDFACQFQKLDFVNPNLGFAISQALDRGAGFVVAKTEDGGDTWHTWTVLPGEDGKEGALHFFDADTGVLRTLNGKLFRTSDGGKTWTGVSGQAEGKPDFEFANQQVGWMVRYRTMTYTVNGGKNWISRDIGFPAPVLAATLPSPDRGYAVGEHGMVYRYRVVPVEYTSKGMMAAPVMASK